jgi:predicted ribosomally synthesized peptide with nif11-like leader
MAIHSEIQRFASDIATHKSLLEQLKQVGTDHEAIVGFANKMGYNFSLDDVKSLPASVGEISDAQLEHVVGGYVMLLFGDWTAYVCVETRRGALAWW